MHDCQLGCFYDAVPKLFGEIQGLVYRYTAYASTSDTYAVTDVRLGAVNLSSGTSGSV